MTAPRHLALAALLLVSAPACASGPDARGGPSPPLSMTLTTADGQALPLASLRGGPVLLFVFTTFDDACQLALTPLSRFATDHPELSVVGVAAQPDPARLLTLYASALAVRFPLGYYGPDRIAAGDSPLGPIETVPAYIVVDARGRIVARRFGGATEEELEALTADVLR